MSADTDPGGCFEVAPNPRLVQVVFAPDNWTPDQTGAFQQALRAVADEHGWPRQFIVAYKAPGPAAAS